MLTLETISRLSPVRGLVLCALCGNCSQPIPGVEGLPLLVQSDQQLAFRVQPDRMLLPAAQ